jgi:putative transposase
MINKAFKFRLKPTQEQVIKLTQWFGISRFIYNYCISENINYYKETKKFLFYNTLGVRLPDLKKTYPWLSDIPSQSLQQKMRDFEKSLKASYKQKDAGFPKFRTKHIESHNSFRIIQTNGHIKPTASHIIIPKLGEVKWKRHRPLEGKLKSITIKKENNYYWCVCLCELPDIQPVQEFTSKDLVGIDVGLTTYAITSDGEVFDTPKFYRKKQHKLKKLQRALAKKKKDSKNRQKAKNRVNKLHYKIKSQRLDFIHQISSSITKDYLFIGIEDLNLKGMSKLYGKSVNDQSFNMFFQQLTYKSLWNGGATIKINRWAPSSKTCSHCGNVKKTLSLSERTYVCSECGLVIDRDANAAINIKKWALDDLMNRYGTYQIKACGDTSGGISGQPLISQVSLNQEKFPLIVEGSPVL